MSTDEAESNNGLYVFIKRWDVVDDWRLVILNARQPAFMTLGEARAFWRRNFSDLTGDYRIIFVDVGDFTPAPFFSVHGTVGES